MRTGRRLPGSSNLAFVERLYADYVRNHAAVPEAWRRYFEEVGDGDGFRSGPSFRPWSIFNPPEEQATATVSVLQERVDMLIRCYRVRGHVIAQLDPLGQPRPVPPELNPDSYGFTAADMDRLVSGDTLSPDRPIRLRELIRRLRNTYGRWIGVQFMHIDDLATRQWLQQRMEPTENRLALSREEQLRILTRLTDAMVFEEFVRKKFIGAKSFLLEGSESLIPLLDLAIEKAGDQGIQEIVLGMAHRGRLNVLANIIGKSPREIFREFADTDGNSPEGRGDVKYHLGFSNDWVTASGRQVHLSLCFNPSHLEFVNPIVLGRMRAKQDRSGDTNRERGLALLIHGDAAFAGEGIIQETLNLSELAGYTVGGTLHVVVNNQIGFTTSPEEGRSSIYCTDVAKMLQIPIFHVNGENPEAVAQVVQLALDFRARFKMDVVIDMYGYRRLGHNEGDEPTFTQPMLYRAIEKRKSVREGYLEHLLKLNEISREEADEIAQRRRERLEQALSEARTESTEKDGSFRELWDGHKRASHSSESDVQTGVERQRLVELLKAQTVFPADFHPHKKILKGVEHRLAMARGEQPLDWSTAESLAFATLAVAGVRIRLTGQDTARGTFSQRHAVLHDFENGHIYVPLQHLAEGQAPVEIYNSPLSEAGVLGFEYGYSMDCPDGLVLWEAQFGDFANAAQVIIDQFIASAETKWKRLSGLVLLLPHGFEGMGPEHSSARLERFLQLAAEDNLQIVYPTTPAQYFHVLRRQMLQRRRKPLVVMTPKSLLRHPQSVSTLDEFSRSGFQCVIKDDDHRNANLTFLCSGKIYFELLQERANRKRDDVAIVRLEQLYPLPQEILQLQRDGQSLTWVQEEPENMGAWRYLQSKLRGRLSLNCVARPESASPATGSMVRHKEKQQELLARAFRG
ncbi:MAG TPA: 2-oxoglutarate dehydrogenase E1 component, partial [Verrucomicrobiae bacterium]|nr:2-oxoglutarate dehydrogenase E1 component [Verrucomicrobiae bacterium]